MPRILLLEDEDDVRAPMARALRGDGHDVVEGGDGNEGLHLLDATVIDLVITDILMPEREGLETITDMLRIRPDLPIIAISGGGAGPAGDYLAIAQALGARYGLEKPFDIAQLTGLVRQLVGGPRRPGALKPDPPRPRQPEKPFAILTPS
jgi:two-component system, chemotaxis family, chemotaxis protein CheY